MAWGKGAGAIQAGIAVASVPRSYGVCRPFSQLLRVVLIFAGECELHVGKSAGISLQIHGLRRAG